MSIGWFFVRFLTWNIFLRAISLIVRLLDIIFKVLLFLLIASVRAIGRDPEFEFILFFFILTLTFFLKWDRFIRGSLFSPIQRAILWVKYQITITINRFHCFPCSYWFFLCIDIIQQSFPIVSSPKLNDESMCQPPQQKEEDSG